MQNHLGFAAPVHLSGAGDEKNTKLGDIPEFETSMRRLVSMIRLIFLLLMLGETLSAQALRETKVVWEKSFPGNGDAKVRLLNGEAEVFYLIIEAHSCEGKTGEAGGASEHKASEGVKVCRFDGRGDLDWEICLSNKRVASFTSCFGNPFWGISVLYRSPAMVNETMETPPALETASLILSDLDPVTGKEQIRLQVKDKKLLQSSRAAFFADSTLLLQHPLGFTTFDTGGKKLGKLAFTHNNFLLQPAFCLHPSLPHFSVFGFSKDDRTKNVDGKTWTRQHERIWLGQFAQSGKLLSSKPVFDRGAAKELSEVQQLPDSSYILCGYFADSIQYGNSLRKAKSPWDIFVSRVSPEGKVLWFNHYPMPTDLLRVEADEEGTSYLLFNPRTANGAFFRILEIKPNGRVIQVGKLDERELKILDFVNVNGELIVVAKKEGEIKLLRLSI